MPKTQISLARQTDLYLPSATIIDPIGLQAKDIAIGKGKTLVDSLATLTSEIASAKNAVDLITNGVGSELDTLQEVVKFIEELDETQAGEIVKKIGEVQKIVDATESALRSSIESTDKNLETAKTELSGKIAEVKQRLDFLTNGGNLAEALDTINEIIQFFEGLDANTNAALVAAVANLSGSISDVSSDLSMNSELLGGQIAELSAKTSASFRKVELNIDGVEESLTGGISNLEIEVGSVDGKVDALAFSVVESIANNRPVIVSFNEQADGVRTKFTANVVNGTQLVLNNGVANFEGADYSVVSSDKGLSIEFFEAPIEGTTLKVYGVIQK
jgi:hypothetical protein